MSATKKLPKTPAEMREQLRQQLREDMTEAVREGNLTLEQAQAQTNERMDAIDERIATLEAAGRRQSAPGSAEETHRGETANLGRVMYSLALKAANEPESVWRGAAELEWEISDQLRAQGVGTDSLGGYLVSGELLLDRIVPLLRPRLIAKMLGATEADFVSSPVTIPKEVTDPSTEALAENEQGTTSEAELGQMSLAPHRAQSYIEASRRLLMMGAGAETILTRMMAKSIATKINLWSLKGEGGKQPVGIFNALGVGSVDFSGVTVSANDVGPDFYQTMLLFEEALEDSDAFHGAGALGWAIPTRVKRAMRQVKSENASAGTQSLDMSRQIITSGTNRELLGYRYETSTQLSGGAESEIIFGDWEQLILATFGNMVLEASNVAGEAMRAQQTHIVAALEVDTAVAQPSAFAVSTGLDLSSL